MCLHSCPKRNATLMNWILVQKAMQNKKKKLSGFQLQPIYPLSFKFISDIGINKDRWSKGCITFGDTPLLQPAFDSCPPCPTEQLELRGPAQLKIPLQAPTFSSSALMKMCQQGRGLVLQLVRIGGCERGKFSPALCKARSIPELHRQKFPSGLMDTSFTGTSTALSQHKASGDSPWEALISYTSVALLFSKSLHMYMAHLVSDYKGGGCFGQMFHLLRTFLLLHIHFSDWPVVIRLIIDIRIYFCLNRKVNFLLTTLIKWTTMFTLVLFWNELLF